MTLREYALEVNEARFVPPLDEDELEKVIKNSCRFPMPEPEPVVVLGGKIAAPEVVSRRAIGGHGT